jgi:hypothetical protein
MNHAVIVLAAAMCSSHSLPRTTLRLDVSERVAAHAAARANGDAAAPAPILMLEDIEIGAGEGLTIDVYGPDQRKVFGVAALVGARQSQLLEPRERMTLVVPLNDHAARAIAQSREITLTLVLRDSPGREPLAIRRAYFREE